MSFKKNMSSIDKIKNPELNLRQDFFFFFLNLLNLRQGNDFIFYLKKKKKKTPKIICIHKMTYDRLGELSTCAWGRCRVWKVCDMVKKG